MEDVEPSKGDADTPVPTAWRPSIEAIVRAFSRGDLSADGIPDVEPLDEAGQRQVQDALEDYDQATLTELPPQTWATSVAQWSGEHWLVYVDLFTVQDGHSDLVLDLTVRETENRYVFSPRLVYVP